MYQKYEKVPVLPVMHSKSKYFANSKKKLRRHSFVCLCVLETLFNPKILGSQQLLSFLAKGLAVWSMSKNQFWCLLNLCQKVNPPRKWSYSAGMCQYNCFICSLVKLQHDFLVFCIILLYLLGLLIRSICWTLSYWVFFTWDIKKY